MDERNTHLIVVPGFILERWLRAVEVKLMRDPNLENEVVHSSDHCVLLALSGKNITEDHPEHILSAIFQVDDEYLKFFLDTIQYLIQDELRNQRLYPKNTDRD